MNRTHQIARRCWALLRRLGVAAWAVLVWLAKDPPGNDPDRNSTAWN